MCEKILTIDDLVTQAEKDFILNFKCKPSIKGFGPGRVNLIGEHTDYNEGFVFPMALPMGTVVVGNLNNSNNCTIITLSNDISRNQRINVKLDSSEIKKSETKWINYVLGVIEYFPSDNKRGFDAVINSSVPLGSGLSSSASLEVAFYTFLEGLYGANAEVTLSEKALICQRSEHQYAGVPCGIMDQFIGFMGADGHALMIDCRDLTNKLVPLKDESVAVLIVSSNVKHDLGSSEYPLRRQHCHAVARKLNKKALRDVTLAELEAAVSSLDNTEYRRARHVISENSRVEQAIEALNNSDFERVGLLMNESHDSLRLDFEVSCKEIDQLVEIARSVDGVYGSRITGGGFGGCTVTLVNRVNVEDVIAAIQKKYSGSAKFYVCRPCCGARLV